MLKQLPRTLLVGILVIVIATLAIAVAVFTSDPDLNRCGAPTFGGDFGLAVDGLVYLQAGCKIRERQSPYLQGKWEVAQPLNPNVNFRNHPFWAWLTSGFEPVAWPIFKSLIAIGISVAGLAGILWFYRAFKLIEPNIHWMKYLAIAPFTGIFLTEVAYGNLDPVMLALSGLLLLFVLQKRVVATGILAALLVSFKLHFWVWPVFFLVVQRDWRNLLKSVLVGILSYLVLTAIFIVVVGPDYGIRTTADYVTFVLQSGKNIQLLGTEAMWNVFNNSLQQTFMRYLGDQSWISIIVAVLTVALWLYLLWLVVKVWRTYQHGIVPGMVALLVALQFHVVALITSPQLETAMIVMAALPLLWGLHSESKVGGVWLLWPYFLLIPIVIVYYATGFALFNWPNVIPITLFTFIVLGVLLHRNISALLRHAVVAIS